MNSAVTPLLTQDDIYAVEAQMRSQWIGRGQRVKELENTMADWVHAKHALCLGSGTASLILALRLLKPGSVVSVGFVTCDAIERAKNFAGVWDNGGVVRISVYPFAGGDIEDFCKHLPRRGTIRLQGRYGVFSFGALKDVSGGLGGCLVSNDPIESLGWEKVSPMSDINAAMVLNQLERYRGHATQRIVAGNKLWEVV